MNPVYEPANQVKPRKNQEWHYNRETPYLADSQTCQPPDNSGTDHKRRKCGQHKEFRHPTRVNPYHRMEFPIYAVFLAVFAWGCCDLRASIQRVGIEPYGCPPEVPARTALDFPIHAQRTVGQGYE